MAVFTDVERVEAWNRRQAGESNRLIGRRLGRATRPRRSCAALRAVRRSSAYRGNQDNREPQQSEMAVSAVIFDSFVGEVAQTAGAGSPSVGSLS